MRMPKRGLAVAAALLMELSPAPGRVFCATPARNQDFPPRIPGTTPAVGQFLAIGDHDTMLTSMDGITWLPGALECAISWQQITAQGNGVFARVEPRTGIETAIDGVSWTGRCSGIPNRLYSVAF